MLGLPDFVTLVFSEGVVPFFGVDPMFSLIGALLGIFLSIGVVIAIHRRTCAFSQKVLDISVWCNVS